MSPIPEATKTALVVEGGGMRGIYAAGVLDAFLSHDFAPFHAYVGVSAGAGNLASFLAGQHQRNLRVYTTLMTRPSFVSLFRFLRGGHYMDLDYLWDTIDKEEPLDIPAIFRRPDLDYTAVVTRLRDNSPVYVRPTLDNCSLVLKASSALPVLYRTELHLDGERVIDGGVADPIPARAAYQRGCRKLVVVRSRPANYRKKPGFESRVSAAVTRGCPELRRAMQEQPHAYCRCMDFLENPPSDAEIVQIAPSEPLRTGRASQSVDHLRMDYERGLRDGEAFVKREKERFSNGSA